MHSKRRWFVVIITVGVLAAAVGFVGFMVSHEDREDEPELVVLQQWDLKAKKPVVFRLVAPKHKAASLVRMSTQDPSTGAERKPMPQFAGDVRYRLVELQGPQGEEFSLNPHPEVGAGQSVEFGVLPPEDELWRLRCQVVLEDRGMMTSLRTRVKWCWRAKSFAPWRWEAPRGLGALVTLESEPITNALPRNF